MSEEYEKLDVEDFNLDIETIEKEEPAYVIDPEAWNREYTISWTVKDEDIDAEYITWVMELFDCSAMYDEDDVFMGFCDVEVTGKNHELAKKIVEKYNDKHDNCGDID